MTIIFNTEPQGSEGWLSARVGCITGSRFRDALDRKKDGGMTAEAMGYAYDLAREREGGKAPETFVNAAMRLGTQEEPVARLTYEAETGQFVEEVGFAHTEDKKFGCSVDGLVPPKGMLEIKTMVSSAVLFKAMVDGDISEYRAQCVGAMWLLSLDWCDLCLWAPRPEGAARCSHRAQRGRDRQARNRPAGVRPAGGVAARQVARQADAGRRARCRHHPRRPCSRHGRPMGTASSAGRHPAADVLGARDASDQDDATGSI